LRPAIHSRSLRNVRLLQRLPPVSPRYSGTGWILVKRDAEKAVWRDALAAMPDLRHDVQEVVVDGDVEMARVVVTGTMARASREIADIAALRAQVAD
jgi:hypothetical protein